MKSIESSIPDVKILTPRVFKDPRGYFFESFNQLKFNDAISPIQFVQDNESLSVYGTLRGIHFQKAPFAQDKLVRVIEGRVWDVAVDLRSSSPTYRQWVGVELTGEGKQQLFIPKGFGHGFLVLSKMALFAYKVSAPYSPEHDAGICYNDPELAIDWPLLSAEYIVSDKDQKLPTLRAFREANDK